MLLSKASITWFLLSLHMERPQTSYSSNQVAWVILPFADMPRHDSGGV